MAAFWWIYDHLFGPLLEVVLFVMSWLAGLILDTLGIPAIVPVAIVNAVHSCAVIIDSFIPIQTFNLGFGMLFLCWTIWWQVKLISSVNKFFWNLLKTLVKNIIEVIKYFF